MDTAAVVTRIASNAASEGFTPIAAGGFEAVFHRRNFKISRFGMVDTILAIRVQTGIATEADLVQTSTDAFVVAKANKHFLPRSLGSVVEVYPITIAPTAAPDALEYVKTKTQNRWGAMTMNGLIHGDPPAAVMFEANKVWGAAYVGSLKKQLSTILS